MLYSTLRLSLGGLGLLASSALATNLYVSSYSGDITSLELSKSDDGSYALAVLAKNNGCAPSPTWLEIDKNTGLLHCLDEGFGNPNGSVSSYTKSASGQLEILDRLDTIGGPVSTVVYNKGKAVAVAHYGGSALSSFNVLDTGLLSPLQDFKFELTAPGTNPDRQEAPHPHEALVDPTDAFIVVPDLGADLIRIYSIDPATSKLTAANDVATPAGSGPRHGAFSVAENGDTFFFLISELANIVTSYKVTYGEKTLGLEQVFTKGVFGDEETPAGTSSGEAILSPDNKFFLTSVRNAPLIEIPNFDPTNSTKIPSDTLQSWAIDYATGELSLGELAPAGGSYPRQFSVNKEGTLAAVGLQMSSRVVIIERNPADGSFGEFVAEVGIAGEVTSVIWDEE